MGLLVLILEVAFLVLAIGGRAWLQRRWTGSSGITIGQASVNGAERAVKVLLTLTVVGLGVATALALADADVPGRWEPSAAQVAVGLVIALVGIAGTLWAQVAMGADWRVGMDHESETALVTGGPFRWMRNPIYSAMILFVLGVALLIPSALTLVLAAATVAEIELQVRAVEEPFLARRHDRDFLGWAARAGRFAPGIGRLRAGT
jgi:protein-S-isoprenylcysteine O-methyltransferase Ste14